MANAAPAARCGASGETREESSEPLAKSGAARDALQTFESARAHAAQRQSGRSEQLVSRFE